MQKDPLSQSLGKRPKNKLVGYFLEIGLNDFFVLLDTKIFVCLRKTRFLIVERI